MQSVGLSLWKINLICDGQQFHQYQQNKQLPLISNQIIENKKDHCIWCWKSKSGLGQTQAIIFCTVLEIKILIYWSESNSWIFSFFDTNSPHYKHRTSSGAYIEDCLYQTLSLEFSKHRSLLTTKIFFIVVTIFRFFLYEKQINIILVFSIL